MNLSPMNFPNPAASSSTRDPAGRGDSGKKTPIVVPIACLNPYQTTWTIRARVTRKNNIRLWSNPRQKGKLFSFDIVDESGEIRVTAFDKEVDKFFPLLETDKVYYISQFKVKDANKKYISLNNSYEMILLSETSIVPCEDDQDLPMVECDFIPIAQLEHMEKDDIIDVIGVCRSVDDLSRFTSKTGREEYRRDIHLMDTSGKAVTVTLWGEQAEKFDGSVQPIVAVKRARLSDFGDQSVSAIFSSAFMVNPDIPEAHRLRRWATSGSFTARPSTTSSTSVVATGASRPSTSPTSATIASTSATRPSTTSTSSTSMTTTGAAMEDDEMEEAPLDPGPPEIIMNLTTEDLVEQDVAVERNEEEQRHTRRHRRYQPPDPLNSFQQRLLQAVERDAAQPDAHRKEDEETLFAMSLVPTLKRLPQQRKAAVKVEMYQLLFEAEFNEIESI
ncbi:replication protein A 70 kDa DNA-binding subunit-like [Salvelinus fontinalis]|uniref:replication protein A 70 kDa DNA-binding subunit-like n=1 Tax=Salvelinus fontinalis TaxID=8038 RepID=UPI0024867ED3|nr:replication protein A 70 kDa DNA-binding subunit-like [Salvelinus fontinalis]